jgi:integrase
MELYLFPIVGRKSIDEFVPVDLLGCARPLQAAGKTETAYRLLRTVSQILRYCVANGWIERDITVDLRGALPSTKTTHLAALTKPADIADLLKAIDQFSGKNESVKNCLRLAPHVFLRPGELRGIKKLWVDFEAKEIVIPAKTMKTRVEHVVPLSSQATAIIEDALHGNDTEYLFPSPVDKTRAISNMAMLVALRRMGYSNEEMTAHGFRAMASTNLEELGFGVRIIELQMAHTDPDPVRAAYKRGASRLQLPRRRKMMREWSDWLDSLRN